MIPNLSWPNAEAAATAQGPVLEIGRCARGDLYVLETRGATYTLVVADPEQGTVAMVATDPEPDLSSPGLWTVEGMGWTSHGLGEGRVALGRPMWMRGKYGQGLLETPCLTSFRRVGDPLRAARLLEAAEREEGRMVRTVVA